MSLRRQEFVSFAGACILLAGCARTEPVTFDLLPASTTARVEAALRVPPSAQLRLELELAPPEADESDEAAPADPVLEIWVHTERSPRGHLFERLPLEHGENSAVLDLDRLAPRKVLVQLLPKGVSPDAVSWRQAQVEANIDSDDESKGEYGPVKADLDAPHIVLYVIDTLRADALSAYGASRETRWIDGFAAKGVRFAHALTPSTWTRPATASLLTGLYPSTHTAEDRPDRLPESSFTLAERLRLLGYSTAAVVANGNVDAAWGFDQGFELYVRPPVPDRDSEGRPMRHLHADEAHEVALREWTRRTKGDDRPLLLYVHTVDPHGPYDPPEWLLSADRPELGNTNTILDELNQRRREATEELMAGLRTLYAGEVAYADREFGEFLSALGAAEDTIIVFTSDHGEAFQEHGFSSHGMSLYQEELEVPLIFWAPGRLPAGTVVEEPVSLLDVVPTLLHLVERRSPADDLIQGAVLEELWMTGDTTPPRLDSRPLMSELDYDGRLWESLRLDSNKLMKHINSDRRWMFDLHGDPGETRNLAPEVGEETWGRLAAALSVVRGEAEKKRLRDPEGTSTSPVPDDVLENLRALGYVQ